MKAVVFDRYGPPERLRLEEVDRPTPKASEVLIRVHAATVSAEDPKMRSFDHPPMFWLPIALLFGFPRPRVRILGMELSGEIEAVGSAVTRFDVGDQVFGYTGIGLGAHAEYKCISERGILARKPKSSTFEEAAAAPNGALTALVYLRNMGKLAAGEQLLVYGASGAVGTAAVQIAKRLGAHVTAVCSTRNLELTLALGADRVVDYTKENFASSGSRYDVVFDTVGKTTFSQARACLNPKGRYLVTVFGLLDLFRMAWSWLGGDVRMVGGASNFHWRTGDLERLASWMEAGEFRSVIDRCYPLSEAADAHHYVQRGHKRGNVVLKMPADDRR